MHTLKLSAPEKTIMYIVKSDTMKFTYLDSGIFWGVDNSNYSQTKLNKDIRILVRN